MSTPCAVCSKPVNPHDSGTWKRVAGWVGRSRKDGMTLREDTGEYAHDHCILALRKGASPDQPSLLEDDLAPAFIIAKLPEGEKVLDTSNEDDMEQLKDLLGEE